MDTKDFSRENLQNIRQEFVGYKDTLLRDIEDILTSSFNIPNELLKYILEMVDYNIAGGKMVRGLFSVYCTYAMCKVWDEQIKKQAFVVGWGAELLQGAFLIADDIMDNAEERRGKPAWYRLENVKLMSINDTFILQSLVYQLIKRSVSSATVYNAIQHTFEEIKFLTEIGQMLDLNTFSHSENCINFKYFTEEYYQEIITNKTAYYTIFLPVYLGLVLAGAPSNVLHAPELKELCFLLGRYFQIRDDYLDAFADPSVLGKKGTDIQEGKCSWVILTVLSMCTEEDRIALRKFYGKSDPTPVKDIYAKYDVKTVFMNYENETLQKVRDILGSSSFPDARLLPFFRTLVEKLFGRVFSVCIN